MPSKSRREALAAFTLIELVLVALLQNGTPELVARAVAQCHAAAGARYIVGAGCEIPRQPPGDYLQARV